MAAVTISASFNFDDSVFDPLLPGDAITINNGATLTINSDCLSTTSSWGGPQNCNLASITINDGTVLIDATKTRILPFINLTGSYLTGSTAVYQGTLTASNGVTGSIIALYIGSPTGSLFFWSGSVKMRSLSGVITSGSTLTFRSGSTSSTATASMNDSVGWLNISFIEAANITTTRQANFIVTGSWITLGTGSNIDNQFFDGYIGRFLNTNPGASTLQTNGTGSHTPSQGVIPAIWVETASGSNVYRPYVNVGLSSSLFALAATSSNDATREDCRGYTFIHTNATRYITASYSASVAATGRNGYRIPSGAQVRVPNVHFTACTAAAKNTSSINSTITTWPKFVTTAAGTIDINNSLGSAFYVVLSQPYDVTLKNSGFSAQASITEVGNNLTMDNVAIGRITTTFPAASLILTANYGNTTITNCNFIANVACANSATAGQTLLVTSCKNVVITGSYISAWGKTGVNAVGMSFANVDEVTVGDCQIVGAMSTVALLSSNITLNNNSYISAFSGSFDTHLQSAWTFTNTSDVLVNGDKTPFLGACGAYAGPFSFTSCTRVELKNIGSFTSPYNHFQYGTSTVTTIPHSAYPLQLINYNIDTKMSRCYFTGSRLGFMNVNNSNDTLFLQNCNGDITNSLQLLARNTKARGLRVGTGILGRINPTATGGGVATGSLLAAVYGTHFYEDFIDNNTGSIGILATEQTSNDYSTGSYTIITSSNSITGSPEFNSNGGLLMRESGSSIIWTWPHYIKGHAGFINAPPQLGVTGSYEYFYDIDYGSGFSSTWTSASRQNLSASSAQINTGSGFKFKLKVDCLSSKPFNQIYGIAFYTTSSLALQTTSSLYPITTTAAQLLLTDLQLGSEIRVYNSGSITELAGVESSSTTFAYNYVWEGTDIPVDIAILNLNYEYIRYQNIQLGSSGLTIPIQQRFDRNYNNPTT